MTQELQLVDDHQGAALPVPQQVPSGLSAIDSMLMRAVDTGNIEVIERMMALKERAEAAEAKKAFTLDMAQFKANAPKITKNKGASFESKKGGGVNYDYADVGHVTSTIIPVLGQYGFSHRWSVAQNGSKISVTCTITHRMGHSESVSLEAEADKTGAKNSIQAIGSAQSYLSRYTLLAACGLAVEDGGDDDGKSFSQEEVDTKFVDEWIAKVVACKTDAEVLAVWDKGAPLMEKRPRDFEDFCAAIATRRGEINGPGAAA